MSKSTTIFELATGLPLLPFSEANERIVTLTKVLTDLVAQIRKGGLVDDHGHSFVKNREFLLAEKEVSKDG